MVDLLSSRQAKELHDALLQYLQPKVSPSVFLELASVLGNANNDTNIPDNYLEKKWATVLRLQRTILDLEIQSQSLVEENKRLTDFLAKGNQTFEAESESLISNLPSLSFKLNWLPTKVKATLRSHTASVNCVAIHPFKPLLATASQAGDINIWNLIDLSEPILVIPNAHSRSINGLAFQATLNDPLLASCSSDQLIKLWDISIAIRENISGSSMIPLSTLIGHTHIVSDIEFSTSSKLLSCSRDNTIRIWDVEGGLCTSVIKGHSDWVRNLSVNENQQWVLSCSSDTSIRLTHIPTQTAVGICIGNDQVIEDVTFLPSSSNKYLDALLSEELLNLNYNEWNFKYAVSVDRSKLLKIWLLPLPLEPLTVGASPRPNINPNGTCLVEFKAHKSWIKSVTVHPNGRWVCTGGEDGLVKLWDLNMIGSISTKDLQFKLSPVKTLQNHDNFVNVVQFATPVLENENQPGLNEENMRCYLFSGGADELVNVWI